MPVSARKSLEITSYLLSHKRNCVFIIDQRHTSRPKTCSTRTQSDETFRLKILSSLPCHLLGGFYIGWLALIYRCRPWYPLSTRNDQLSGYYSTCMSVSGKLSSLSCFLRAALCHCRLRRNMAIYDILPGRCDEERQKRPLGRTETSAFIPYSWCFLLKYGFSSSHVPVNLCLCWNRKSVWYFALLKWLKEKSSWRKALIVKYFFTSFNNLSYKWSEQ